MTTPPRTIAVRRILVDHLAGIGPRSEFVRVIPALLGALGPHLDPAPLLDPPNVDDAAVAAARDEHVLTDRQVQVLQLAACGHTDREIGVRLGIGEDTVKTHIKHSFVRLGGVRSRAEAVAVGIRRGIIE